MKTVESIVEELRENLAEMGDITVITVEPGGTMNGLDYGPSVYEVVYLDKYTVAYRYSNDAIDGDWVIGDIETVADEVVQKQTEIIKSTLTDEDIEAWHNGEMTPTLEDLIMCFGAFKTRGSCTGPEPLTIIPAE